MFFEHFIAKRILKGSGTRVSRPIVFIATTAVAVGIALMIISIAVLKGFQTEIRNKVVGFGSHIQVIPVGDYQSKESKRMVYDPLLAAQLDSIPGVRHVQKFAVKPGILESAEGLQGVVIKGVSADHDWGFFVDKIVRGRPLKLEPGVLASEIIISEYQANRLQLDTGDRVTTYFVQNEDDIKPRPFKICGIYNTGLEDFDRSYVMTDLGHIQTIGSWGLEAQLRVKANDGGYSIEGLAFGGSRRFSYEWDEAELKGPGPHQVVPEAGSEIRLIVTDDQRTLGDTAWVSFFTGADGLDFSTRTSGGSYKAYVGGLEVLIDDYERLFDLDDEVYKAIPYDTQTMAITEQYPEIFNWLSMLDINVVIIIALMIFISIVNMTSALLIIILERTRMIGLLKAIGATDSSVLFIFLENSAFIVGIGVLLGNLLGLGLAWAQKSTGFIQLNATNYFVSEVPILFDVSSFVWVNVICVGLCVIFLIFPANYVTNITPIRALRFD